MFWVGLAYECESKYDKIVAFINNWLRHIMTKKRGLSRNRGLDVLMGDIKKERQIAGMMVDLPDANEAPNKDGMVLMQMAVARLQSGRYQPRQEMDETALLELSASIAKHGVMQPIVVRPLLADELGDDGITHEIIAGERRWRAAKLAGLSEVPAIERALSDELAIALALIENIQREDLNALEQASALQRFHTEFGMSHAMIADVVGKARATVSNLLRLNALHATVKDYMMASKLDMGHARALLSLPTDSQPIIAKKIIDGNLTVRQAENLVKSIINPSTAHPKTSNHEMALLNRKLSDRLGMVVKCKKGQDGKGSMEIFFHDDAQFQAILQQFGVEL